MPSANMRTVLQMVYLMGILVGTYHQVICIRVLVLPVQHFEY